METRSAVDGLSELVPRSDLTYFDQTDGLYHCSICGEPVQVTGVLQGKKKIVSCLCACQTESEKKKEAERAAEIAAYSIAEMRRAGLPDEKLRSYTFDAMDDPQMPASIAARNYAENFDTFRKRGKGILFHGGVGTGKTYLAACIANTLIDNAIPAIMTNMTRIVNRLQSTYKYRQKFINALDRFELLVLDDLAAERESDYMLEQEFNIVDARARSGKPLIVTTNLTLAALSNPPTLRLARIYDRVISMCLPVEVSGQSRRRKKCIEDYNEMQTILDAK